MCVCVGTGGGGCLGLSCECWEERGSIWQRGRQLCGYQVQGTLLQKGPSPRHLQNTSELRLSALFYTKDGQMPPHPLVTL